MSKINRPYNILFLRLDAGENGSGSAVKQVDEIKTILEAVQGNRFFVIDTKGMSLSEIESLISEKKPNIIHVSGHGSKDTLRFANFFQAILNGKPQTTFDLNKAEFERIFRSHRDVKPSLLFINACFAAEIAEYMQGSFDCAIGMGNALHQELALEIAREFYQRIARGETIKEGINLDGHILALVKERNLENSEGVKPAPKIFGNPYIKFDLSTVVGRVDRLESQRKDLIDDKTKWFVGRNYVFKAIQAFIETHSNGYFTIIGDPGQGKSAILAKYVKDTNCIAHFNVRTDGITRAEQFLESICKQLIRRYDLNYDSLPEGATQDGVSLGEILRESASKAKGQPIVVAVDALDEVDLANSGDSNILYLPSRLPDGIYFILTRRRVELPLTVSVAEQSLNLLDEQYQAGTEQDIQMYIQKRMNESLSLRERIDQENYCLQDFINTLTQNSEMNFMYLFYILNDIEKGLYKDFADLTHLPKGLKGYYEWHWNRMEMKNENNKVLKRRIIVILGQALLPASRSLIAEFAETSITNVQEVIDDWKQFLHGQKIDGQNCYSIYHSSFLEFLNRQDIIEAAKVEMKEANIYIAALLWQG